ncbi:MAG TPA: flagellar biosynthetic protein FliR [Dissulfurispiraceae bacterium]|nr:flagellar biosynthetic protein FliR [Dissulfurispiraceae bacterium]
MNLINSYGDRFVPVFIRVATMLTFIPFVGSTATPIFVRIGIMLALTFLLLPIVQVQTVNMVHAVFESAFIGMAIGLCARLILGAVEMAAQWISIEMGIGVAAVFNPQFGEVLGPLSLFYSFAAMGLFVALDMHYFFIEGIARSFSVTTVQYQGMFDAVLKLNGFFFPLAFQIAAPIFLIQILVNLGMGFLSRAMPQANIFFVSFPLLITAGIVSIIISLGLSFMVVTKGFSHIRDAIAAFTR